MLNEIDEADLDTSPTMFDAEIDIPQGIRIEVARHGQRWLCSLKGKTLCSVSGVVSGGDFVMIVMLRNDLIEQAARIKRWLTNQGMTNVAIERRRVDFPQGAD